MAYKFGIVDAKIASWTAAQTWGTPYDLDGVQMMTVDVNTVSGVLEGDDEIKDAHAKIISANVRVRFAFASMQVYNILTGQAYTDSGSVETMTLAPGNMRYFGICGRLDHTDGVGDAHLFLGKCKVMEGFTLGGEYGRYVTPELNCLALNEGVVYGVFRVIEHDTAQAVTIPPT